MPYNKLTHKQLRPFNTEVAKFLIAQIKKGRSSQGAAANVTSPNGVVPNFDPVDQNCTIQDIVFISSVTPGAGESLVIDVTVNGTTILTGTFTFNNTLLGDQAYSLKGLLTTTGAFLKIGDVVRVIRTYTAGGGPTMGTTAVNAVTIYAAPETAS